MSVPDFMVFTEDEHAVALDHITGFSAVLESERHRPVPINAQTRIDTRSGYFYVTTPFAEIVEQLQLLKQASDG